MKATLKFDLPEESEELVIALNATKIYSALQEIRLHVRNKLKYAELQEETRQELAQINDLILEEFNSLPEELR